MFWLYAKRRQSGCGIRSVPAQSSSVSALLYVASASPLWPVAASRSATAVRLRPTSTLIAESAPGSTASASRTASTWRCAASAASLWPTFDGQLRHLELGLRERPPRRQVGLLAEQGAEFAVEVEADFRSRSRSALNWSCLSRKSSLTPVWKVLIASTARS